MIFGSASHGQACACELEKEIDHQHAQDGDHEGPHQVLLQDDDDVVPVVDEGCGDFVGIGCRENLGEITLHAAEK